jgi:hypothetical protein
MPTIKIREGDSSQIDRLDKCAVLIALPLDMEHFVQSLRCGQEGTFAKAFQAAGRSNLPERTVAQLFQTTADLVQDVLEEATRLGVRVLRNASLQEFADLVSSHTVVTLVAHSRDARFFESDVTDLDAVFDALESRDSQFSKVVAELLMGSTDATLPQRGKSICEMVTFLNTLITSREQLRNERKLGEITRKQLEWRKCRSKLESALPQAFRGAR